jgi:hypothetical protein
MTAYEVFACLDVGPEEYKHLAEPLVVTIRQIETVMKTSMGATDINRYVKGEKRIDPIEEMFSQ